jgi:hypothetical protein
MNYSELRTNENGLCKKLLHFPERIYEWSLTEKMANNLYAHCAICGTDYKITYTKVEK